MCIPTCFLDNWNLPNLGNKLTWLSNSFSHWDNQSDWGRKNRGLVQSEDHLSLETCPFRSSDYSSENRLGFATTINKAHGQSLSTADRNLPRFSNGQLYVAYSSWSLMGRGPMLTVSAFSSFLKPKVNSDNKVVLARGFIGATMHISNEWMSQDCYTAGRWTS